MHKQAASFCEDIARRAPKYFKDQRVLEVGSLNINGSVRDLFEGGEYMGIDLGPGPGVDRVAHVLELEGISAHFDVVVSTEALEHDKSWGASLDRMASLVKPDGLLLITCAAPGRPEHGTAATDAESSPSTLDWYHNISFADFWSVIRPQDWKDFIFRIREDDLYFAGVKKG
jgi:SAM-dependent methyltransferase